MIPFPQFVAFWEAQPREMTIDHTYWDTCAVGDFARHLGKDASDVSNCIAWPNGLRYIVGNGESAGNTYGEFTDFIKSYAKSS